MNRSLTSLGTSLARGSLWVALGQTVGALSSLAGTVVAARVLSPEDFGLVGVALLTITTLGAFSQTGFDRALIQRESADGYLETAFAVQIGRSALMALLLLFASYPISWIYDRPALVPIFAVMSLSVVTSGMRNIATVFFHRTLNFRAIVTIGICKALLKMAFVLTLLLTLRSVWALVLGHLFAALTDVALSYWVQRKRVIPRWDGPKARELLQFGKWVSGMTVLGFAVTKGDDIFISKYLGVAALGLYGVAFEIGNLPSTHVTHVVGKVSFPTYARLYETGNKKELRRLFLKVMKSNLLMTGPLSLLIFLGADGIVHHVLGPKWLEAAPLVRILAAAGFVRSVAGLAGGVFHGTGHPRLDFRMNLPRFLILSGLIWPACAWKGLEGAAWLVLLSISSTLPAWYLGLRSLVGLTARDLATETALPVAVTSVVGLCYVASSHWMVGGSLPLFGLQLVVTLTSAALLLWALGRVTRLDLYSEIGVLSGVLRRKN